MPAVIRNNLGSRILNHPIIFLGEKWGNEPGDQWLNIADDNPFNTRMHHERSGSNSGATGDDQDRFRLRMRQGRQMPQHPLQAHVARFIGGLDFAGRMEIAHPRGPGGYGN